MITIAVLAQKGGVGKTTTAEALGAGLMRYHSARVLFVDLDAQRNLSRTLEADYSGERPDSLDLITGRAKAKDAIQKTIHGDIIPASHALVGADREKALNDVGREYRLREALRPISGSYDYCVIDTPPALGILIINALTAADKAIIPAQADDYSLDALEDLSGTIQAVKLYTNKSLQIDGILITRYNGRPNISRYYEEQLEEAAHSLGSRLYQVRIRECSALKEAQGLREDIFTYSPRSNAGRDYKQFIDELTGTQAEEGTGNNG